MNLAKSLDFFDPVTELKTDIHIIGVGAIGSNIAENLARLGVEKLHLYDFDKVETHNITNQLYTEDHIGKTKLEAISEIIKSINPACKLVLHDKGWTPQTRLNGYVILAVDNIELRHRIVTENKFNQFIAGMFDFRMGLTDAQHYAADWKNMDQINNFLATMDFTHEDAKENVPVSPCGTTLNVLPTVRTITSLGIANLINFIKSSKIKTVILIDAFKFALTTF